MRYVNNFIILNPTSKSPLRELLGTMTMFLAQYIFIQIVFLYFLIFELGFCAMTLLLISVWLLENMIGRDKVCAMSNFGLLRCWSCVRIHRDSKTKLTLCLVRRLSGTYRHLVLLKVK